MSPSSVTKNIYCFSSNTKISFTPINFFFCLYTLGLNYVEEVSYTDPHGDPRYEPRYTCLLCRQQAPLTEMVRHLIGRKHRQKYLVKPYERFLAPTGERFECLLPFSFLGQNKLRVFSSPCRR